MSLLHRQIAERMTRSEPVSHRVDRLLTFVGEEMSSPPMNQSMAMKASVGSVLGVKRLVSMTDVRECSTAVQDVIQRLDNDITTFFAKRWSDPAKADEPVPVDEKSYYDRWKTFVARFGMWKANEVDACHGWDPASLALQGCFPGPLYDQCDDWNTQHDAWYDSFQKDWKGTPTGPKNTKTDQGDQFSLGSSTSVSWFTIGVGAAVALGVAALYFRPKILSPAR